MNPQLEQALAELRDIHLPAEPGWWPPAPGWWAIGFAGIVLLIWLFRLLRRQWQRSEPLRAYRDALSSLSFSPDTVQQDLARASALTRQLAIQRHGREKVASLTGEAWLNQLDQLSGSRDFSAGPGRVLSNGPYRRTTIDDPEALRVALLGVARRAVR